MTPSFSPGMPMWLDLGTTDLEASKNFYGRLFGWEFEDLGPEAGGYNFARIGGKMVCGIGPAQDPAHGSFWGVVFHTDNTDETVAKAEAAGAKVLTPPMDVMASGRMAVLADTSGAAFSVWQPMGHGGAEVMHEHGTFTWAELSTNDLNAAKAFYPRVLPVTISDYDLGDGMTYAVFSVNGASVAGAMINPSVPPSWGVYFAVDDTDVTADQAIELGATELMRDNAPPGRLAMLIDPQGAPFAIIKNDPDFQM
jgi:uncharacterized protein